MTQDTSATQRLRDEHTWILKVASVLEHLADRGQQGEWDFESFDDCVSFVRLYADACHHGKEEDLLFTSLEDRGMSRHEGPIARMLEEHRMARDLTSEMGASIEGARRGNEADQGTLMRAAYDYVDLIRGHIGKEDNVLFETADALLGGPACAKLCADYDRVCNKVFDGCSKAQLEALAERLTARYSI